MWVSGTSGQRFDLIDGMTGAIKRAEPSVGFGGYGGLIDKNGVIWSARPMLRWDTSKPLTGPNAVSGMAFTLFGGRATWDRAGKTSTQPPFESVWVEDRTPEGASLAGDGEGWNWISANPTPFSGTLAHQSNLVGGTHQHYFHGANEALSVGAGDSLFSYVYLDPANPPTQVMMQWNNGNWEHRAYWGANQIPFGVNGTVSRRNMGPLPAPGQWVRLEVPASQVGLEGSGTNWRGYNHDSYGLCIDSQGNVWNTSLGPGTIRKFAPDGTQLGIFNQGDSQAQGCVVDQNDHVWVAHSLFRSTVGHLKNDGSYVGTVTVGSGPTGVAVDGAGKIWATNHNSRTVSRINPNLGPLGPDGVTRVGAVEFTTPNLGGDLYNYSDMTGSTLTGAPGTGTWTTVFDSGIVGAEWGRIGWTAQVCGDGLLTVSVASSTNGTTFGPAETVANGADPAVANGRYLRISVSFKRASSGESPVLYDLSVGTDGYTLPDAPNAAPTAFAGADQTVTLPDAAKLDGVACDDGFPRGNPLAVTWSKVSGPGTAIITPLNSTAADATFTLPGDYVLRLTASDGEHSVSDEVTVTALPANMAPIVNAGPNQTITLPNTASLERHGERRRAARGRHADDLLEPAERPRHRHLRRPRLPGHGRRLPRARHLHAAPHRQRHAPRQHRRRGHHRQRLARPRRRDALARRGQRRPLRDRHDAAAQRHAQELGGQPARQLRRGVHHHRPERDDRQRRHQRGGRRHLQLLRLEPRHGHRRARSCGAPPPPTSTRPRWRWSGR